METTDDFLTNLIRGSVLSAFVLILTALLELLCRDEVNKLLGKRGGRELYVQAWIANLNVPIFGAITYHLTMVTSSFGVQPMTTLQRFSSVAGIIITEGILYTMVHRAFHEVPGLWWAHRFHHKFNDVVLPSSANAVSVTEFTVAYMIPIIAGSFFTGADELSAIVAVIIISVANLLIHTPLLFERYEPPWFLVSTKDHFRHHRRLERVYAAPLIHFERIAGSSLLAAKLSSRKGASDPSS